MQFRHESSRRELVKSKKQGDDNGLIGTKPTTAEGSGEEIFGGPRVDDGSFPCDSIRNSLSARLCHPTTFNAANHFLNIASQKAHPSRE
jgi:hypothetical protein